MPQVWVFYELSLAAAMAGCFYLLINVVVFFFLTEFCWRVAFLCLVLTAWGRNMLFKLKTRVLIFINTHMRVYAVLAAIHPAEL